MEFKDELIHIFDEHVIEEIGKLAKEDGISEQQWIKNVVEERVQTITMRKKIGLK